ncbi:Periplasmic component of an ABC superfamily branched-chain amino acid transporter, partial [Pseudomonas savastanoi pv. glycinea]
MPDSVHHHYRRAGQCARQLPWRSVHRAVPDSARQPQRLVAGRPDRFRATGKHSENAFRRLDHRFSDQGARRAGASLAALSSARTRLAAALLTGYSLTKTSCTSRNAPMKHRKSLLRLALGMALLGCGLATTAQAANEQYFPLQSYRVGPYAAGGTGFFGGFIDYLQYVNANGGVNGVKLTWSECETEYVVEKGVECYERLKGGLNGAPAAATNRDCQKF